MPTRHSFVVSDVGCAFINFMDVGGMLTEHSLVTPVTALPTGKEKGKFLSIDVDGTNLRVGFVELIGEPDGGAVVKSSHCYPYREAGFQEVPARAADLYGGL